MKLLVVAANATVGIADGHIVPSSGHFDATIRIPDGEVRPGLINAHDHLHRNHYGRLGTPPYASAYEWGRDIHIRHANAIARGRAVPRRAALERGAWKNICAGVTTVAHHDPWEAAFDEEFPLRVARIRCADSLRLEPELPELTSGTGPFAIHLAEGTDDPAAHEVWEAEQRGLLTSDLLAVHVVGAAADGVRRLRGSGAAMVWCPTSNTFLFGRTASGDLLAPGMDVLLGSDSLLTGAGTLLDELRYARELGVVSDERLLDAVGRVAARRLGLPQPTLECGAPADVVVLRRPVLEARARDVALVVVAGTPRAVDPALVSALGPWAQEGCLVRVNGMVRWVLGMTPALLAADAQAQ
jgi:hypothetical protein